MTEHAITGDLATLLGEAHTPGDPVALWVEASQSIVLDAGTGRIGGKVRVPVDADGSFTVEGLPATVSGTPLYRLVVEARSLRLAGGNSGLVTKWFPLTADRDLAWIVTNYVDITVITPTIAANIAAAVALGTTNDTATASFVNDSGSSTRAALDARYNAPASSTAAGRVELATASEVEAGTDTDRAVTPSAAISVLERRSRLTVGTTNADHPTLASALAAASAGTEILLRAGTHAISGANTVPAGVRIRGYAPGAGTGVAVIQGSYTTTVSALTLQAGSSIEGVPLNNTSTTGGTGSVVPVACDIRGAGVVVRDCTFTGPWSQAILAYQSTDVRITDCTFDSIGKTTGTTPGDAINLYGVNGAIVQGCQVRNSRQNAIYVNASAKNVTIIGNTVRGCPEGIQVRVGCSNVTITGNVFDITGASGVNSFGIIVQTQCTDTVISGNTFRTSTGTATPFAAINVDDRSHRTIIDANTIAGAGFGAGILVATTGAAGTESQNAVITNNLIEAPGGIGIRVAANENAVVVSGNRINGGTNKGIQIQANRAAVTGNVVTNPAGTDGITVAGAYSTVTGNIVTNVIAGAGILVSGTDNTITGNTCIGNATYGISDTGNTNLIVGNNCGGNSHATADINSAGAASKVAYNIGRYTQKGAA